MELAVDGKTVYAYTAARSLSANAPSVVFLHGAANDHSVWALQSRYFAYHGRNALAVDLPGHGRSAGEPLPTISALADWTTRLLDAASIERAALVGHSMGSLIALEAAARHPQRAEKLALLGSAFPMRVSETLLNAAHANDHAALDMITLWGHSPQAQLGGNPVPGLWMTGNYLRLIERAKPGVLFTDLKACNDYRDGLESAPRVTCPTLVLSGKRDVMTPARAAQALAGKLNNSKTVTLDGTGHALMTEQPDRVLDALIGFLS
jgi:pimeloyl-ACP methyl ester carboxylesterase